MLRFHSVHEHERAAQGQAKKGVKRAGQSRALREVHEVSGNDFSRVSTWKWFVKKRTLLDPLNSRVKQSMKLYDELDHAGM